MILALAMALDALLGEPDWLWSRVPHPAVLMGKAITALEAQLNTGTFRRAKGGLLVFILLSGAILLGLALAMLGPVAEVVCSAILLAQKSLVQHVGAVASCLRQSLAQGRNSVAKIVSRDCSDMNQAQITRSAIESAAENLSDGVVAPVFWFALAGLPGLLAYKVINTADSMVGYRDEQFGEFGWASARLDDVLNLIPARLAGLMIAGLSGHLGAWPAIMTDARRHKSPNAGWPEAATARALNIALAGPRSYDGVMQPLAWVNGVARKESGPTDIDATITLLWKVWAFLLILAIAIAGIQTLV